MGGKKDSRVRVELFVLFAVKLFRFNRSSGSATGFKLRKERDGSD